MATLLTIPLELLVAVSEYLTTPDLGSLRLTCKQTEKSLYEWFSKEFFTKKQFMLTPTSLQTFIDISKHVSFSKKLSHVIIATNVYAEIPLRFRDEGAAARYIQGFEDQKALLSTGVDREMLTEAFQGLVNLDTIGIRDFNASNRVRDGESWSSWGAPTIHRETGIELQFSDRSAYTAELSGRFVSRVFTSVLYALGKAKRQPLSIELLLRQHGLPDGAFALPDFLRPTMEPALANLTSLLLNVDLMKRYVHTHANGSQSDAHAGRALRRFLGCTPKLVHLRLNFEKHLVTFNDEFMQWLAGDAPATHTTDVDFFNPPRIALKHLKKLEFGKLTINIDVLLSVVEKFAPTLESLGLWRMNLTKANTSNGDSNLWKELFGKLQSNQQLHLNHLKVGMLQQDHKFVNFNTGVEGAQALKEKEYTGSDMDKFWVELQEQVWVFKAVVVVESESDEDMDDEDDEDDEVADEGSEDSEDDEEDNNGV